ncbi:MAG: hypothetical protein A2033_07025 [Bacteroidetes bacterium GWA2_31_9]|nr:MAG: hypothetical protein A2033_07025 [Bacteroidetes bacterium GWA2_31_9]
MRKYLIPFNLYLFTFTFYFLSLSFSAFSQDFPERPSPPKLVNDFFGILDANQNSTLETTLYNFNKETSTQITVVIVKSLNGYEKSEFAYTLGEKWGVGQKGQNNGIVVLVKPKTAEEKGEAFIAAGYGLEGAVPDATAKNIVENEMIPSFKQNDYYTGIANAVNTLMSITKGEFTAKDYDKKGSNSTIIIIIIIVIIFIIIAVKNKKGGSSGAGHIGTGGMFIGGMGSGGGWSNFSSGGGSFGGFGGGSFGGGGAGGSW